MDLGARNQPPRVQSKTTNSQGKILIFDRDLSQPPSSNLLVVLVIRLKGYSWFQFHFAKRQLASDFILRSWEEGKYETGRN